MNIVFFDGYCNLCNGFINWLIKRDKHMTFKYASLQGEAAKKYLKQNSFVQNNPTTIVYLKNDAQYEMSSAVLMIFNDLGGLWKSVKIFFILPKGFRDLIYKLVAKNRYLIFGKRQSCRLPTAQEKKHFLP